MIKTVPLEIHGLRLFVEVEYDGEGKEVNACGVLSVAAVPEKGAVIALKCDTARFFKDLEGEVQEALENEIQADYEAYCDAMYEQAREEGRL